MQAAVINYTKKLPQHPKSDVETKFEWTVEEFAQWCSAVAAEWGYTVEVGGVGKAREVDGWGRDDALGWASQTAAFTRIEGRTPSWSRAMLAE